MKLSFRQRIVLTLTPLFLLLAALGGSGVVLLSWLGGRIDLILKENYQSVLMMRDLDEAVERMDGTFHRGPAVAEERRPGALARYQAARAALWDAFGREENNITIEGEAELVEQLRAAATEFCRQGDAFHALAACRPVGAVGAGTPLTASAWLAADPAAPERDRLRSGGESPGLRDAAAAVKAASAAVTKLNEENMKQANAAAHRAAEVSLAGFTAGLVAVAALAVLVVAQTVRTILRPIRSVTRSVLAIGEGDLDQVVPVTSADELGHLAEAFNLMARQLRHYRQTDYSRLVRAQRTAQATIDSFPDPVLVLNPDGRVEMANPAARRLHGLASAADGRDLTWAAPEPLRGPLSDALTQQRPHLPEHFDQVLSLAEDGRERSFLPRILPIRDPYGQSLGAAVLLADVTRFRLLDQVKSDLVATVSHEMKTPLASIRMAVHLLLEEAVGPLTPKQTELLLDARDNAERLLATVNHLLELARLEQGRQNLDLRPASPRELLTAAAEVVRPRAEDRGVSVTVDVPDDLPTVAADPERLGLALGNLLDNALTYTDPGGRISLSAAAVDGGVTLTVTDTGVGIPPAQLPRLFERFSRIPGQSRGQGTGLGLAIVREIVSAHGGTIVCDSRPGEGTVFRLNLPVWKHDEVTR